MLSLLARPYRASVKGFAAWWTSAGFALFVALFLMFFRPFGLNTMGRFIIPIALGYGGVCFVVMMGLNIMVSTWWREEFTEQRWTVGKELLWVGMNVMLVGLGNVLYSMAIGVASFTWVDVVRFEIYTLAIGIFPWALAVLLDEARLSRRYREGSQRFNAELDRGATNEVAAQDVGHSTQKGVGSADAMITIPSETGKEDLVLHLNDLLFIRSSGNYIEVHRLAGDRVDRTVMRGSLKRAEEAVQSFPRILRCHKSHMVNLDMVRRVSGNAQGYHLHVGDGVDTVPVSRQLNDRLGELLEGHP